MVQRDRDRGRDSEASAGGIDDGLGLQWSEEPSMVYGKPEAALMRRLEELDSEPQLDSGDLSYVAPAKRCTATWLWQFGDVMGRWTKATVEAEIGARALITPGAADALVSHSRLLADIGQFDPTLVAGPLSTASQHWTPQGPAAWTGAPPSEAKFNSPRADRQASVKPSDFGIYTSTATPADVSMWRAFLGPGGSATLPLPRYTWELQIARDVTVAEIGSAAAWVDLIRAHPHLCEGRVFPDWIAIARSFDAVHLTLPAIAAAQGFSFDTEHGEIPAAYWDVETTFWLRWCFSAARPVESI